MERKFVAACVANYWQSPANDTVIFVNYIHSFPLLFLLIKLLLKGAGPLSFIFLFKRQQYYFSKEGQRGRIHGTPLFSFIHPSSFKRVIKKEERSSIPSGGERKEVKKK